MEDNKKIFSLQVEDLYVQYDTSEGTSYAVNGISFQIRKGETFGLVGETGAGKTTTALAILKLFAQEGGQHQQRKN